MNTPRVTPVSPVWPVAGRLVSSLLIAALAIGIFIYRQELIDQFNVKSYTPSPAISAMAERSGINDRGVFYLYASRPEVQERVPFNKSCTTMRGEVTAVLGCYVAQRIYLFDVKDERLDGIKEVTAAHEMLHAAYERLDTKDKTRVNDLLIKESARITDPAFKELLKAYEQSEPGERNNELHSLIGTQVFPISPELEAYYGRYFNDRSKVVQLYAKYEAVFAQLKSQQDALARELESLSVRISEGVGTYNSRIAQLNTDIEAFNSRARAGSFSSREEFDAVRNGLIARQNELVVLRDSMNAMISTFNAKRQQLAAINSQADALNRSINSNLEPLSAIDG